LAIVHPHLRPCSRPNPRLRRSLMPYENSHSHWYKKSVWSRLPSTYQASAARIPCPAYRATPEHDEFRPCRSSSQRRSSRDCGSIRCLASHAIRSANRYRTRARGPAPSFRKGGPTRRARQPCRALTESPRRFATSISLRKLSLVTAICVCMSRVLLGPARYVIVT